MSEHALHHAGVAPEIRAAFVEHLRETPNKRRVSKAGKESILHWLTDVTTKPVSQQEYSRRNYIQKTFWWDNDDQDVFSVPKKKGAGKKRVVTEDMIPDIVAHIHEKNDHTGWDATWKDVSNAYYGILRADVIFLLKRCPTCAMNPRKKPKSMASNAADFQAEAQNLDMLWTFGEGEPSFDSLDLFKGSGSDAA